MCKDQIFPYIHVFAKGGGRSGQEPIRGYVLTFIVAIGFVLIGETINSIGTGELAHYLQEVQ